MKSIMNPDKKIKIVIIDSGVNIKYYNLKENVLESIGFRIDIDGTIEKVKNPIVENEHGTLVASCIKYIYKDIEFIDINILDKDLSTNGNVLIKALKHSLSYNPNIVHLSLGTTSAKYWIALKKIIRKLHKKNVIVVAALTNYGSKSYRACFKEVIGVRGGEEYDMYKYNYMNKFFYTYNRLPLDLCKNKRHQEIRGNSISCAYMTGNICKIINNVENEVTKEILKNYKI
ncbi:MAG TPA: subtilase [Clostridium sp.]|nr:subtilase [Clostridium sp.]